MNERLKELAERARLDPCVFYDNLLRLSDFSELVRQDERESCAKLCENLHNCEPELRPDDCAKEIRARGIMQRIDLIIDALENSEPTGKGWVHVHEQKHQAALAAARQLRELKPVAWMQKSLELYVNDQPTSIYKIPLSAAPPKREQTHDCGVAGHDEGRCGNFHCITKPASPRQESSKKDLKLAQDEIDLIVEAQVVDAMQKGLNV